MLERDLDANDDLLIRKKWVTALKAIRLAEGGAIPDASKMANLRDIYRNLFLTFSDFFAREEIREPLRLKRRKSWSSSLDVLGVRSTLVTRSMSASPHIFCS